MITFDEKLEAAWGLHKIEKAVLEKKIADLRAENEKLREALRPFAADAGDFDFMEDHDEVGVPVGDLRAAAAAIRESGDE